MTDFGAFHHAHGVYATHIHEAAHANGAANPLDPDFRPAPSGWMRRYANQYRMNYADTRLYNRATRSGPISRTRSMPPP
jgi:antirestriction protein ArdC